VGADASTRSVDPSASPSDESSKATPKDRQPGQVSQPRLTPDQARLVQELAQTDQKVRAHEAAHQAAAGGLGGAVSFSYQTGPDGRSYAVGGEVPVDMSSGRTPEETMARAEQIRAAALAPADPSPQDLSVAAQASQMEAAARQEMLQQQMAVLHARQAGRTDAAPVLGARPGAGAEGEAHASGDSTSTSVSGSGQPDVGQQALTTLATLASDRAASGTTSVQVQQLARLASAAYGM